MEHRTWELKKLNPTAMAKVSVSQGLLFLIYKVPYIPTLSCHYSCHYCERVRYLAWYLANSGHFSHLDSKSRKGSKNTENEPLKYDHK